MLVGQFSSVLLLGFFLDAVLAKWRQGHPGRVCCSWAGAW